MEKSAARDTIIGIAAPIMKGWRRPKDDRLLSDIDPTSGSTTESTIRAAAREAPAAAPDRPQTAVR